jgi:hypothetical protein
VVEAIYALYASATQGRRIELPFLSASARPIDHWRPAVPVNTSAPSHNMA